MPYQANTKCRTKNACADIRNTSHTLVEKYYAAVELLEEPVCDGIVTRVVGEQGSVSRVSGFPEYPKASFPGLLDGTGTVTRDPFDCSNCHSTNHPQGLCPYNTIPGFYGTLQDEGKRDSGKRDKGKQREGGLRYEEYSNNFSERYTPKLGGPSGTARTKAYPGTDEPRAKKLKSCVDLNRERFGGNNGQSTSHAPNEEGRDICSGHVAVGSSCEVEESREREAEPSEGTDSHSQGNDATSMEGLRTPAVQGSRNAGREAQNAPPYNPRQRGDHGRDTSEARQVPSENGDSQQQRGGANTTEPTQTRSTRQNAPRRTH
ncbi:hypothetical protein ARMGADRAFT_1034525 [Armillaria gallica]|uniref:Uncharacterized protein n=1 Tax=Armillaria gallica TaxID=47427 RepID=A0A2H3DKF3_ARMGA|nr:hypothetical protein ARMGADRAFT_1034525 [Armillaria gallica]